MFFTKQAAQADLEKAADIMRRVLDEEPSYWPYGLEVGQFDGGLYLISKQASSEPVGFVGWQVRQEQGRDIGYYAIGVLPEHRQQGFAKQAVQALLREKAASVDEVRALVCSHNQPSKNLAHSVGVTLVEKVAAISKMATGLKGQIAGAALGALGSVPLWDQIADPGRSMESSFKPWEWDKQRLQIGAVNALLGGLGGQQIADKNIGKGLFALTSAPAKDLMLKGMGSLHKIDKVSDLSANALTRDPASGAPAKTLLESIPKEILLGALGLGVGGLGVAAYSAKRKADNAKEQVAATRAGRVKVTLPTKKPGDSETTLDLPIDDIKMSDAQRERLGIDARRRLYEESRSRRVKRKPRNPAAPTDREKVEQALEAEEAAEMAKESSLIDLLQEIRPYSFIKEAVGPNPAPQSSVPTPPPQGVNPAARMTQQQVTANAMQPSTDANPQIMKAQQDAAQAQMSAEQQSAQAQQEAAQQAQQLQQEAAQAQMQQQVKFQEQLAKANQKSEVLEMKLEKAKVQSDLEKAKAKAQADISAHQGKLSAGTASGEASAVQRLTQSRLDRIQSKMKKVAVDMTGVPGTTDPKSGLPVPPRMQQLRPDAAQKANDSTVPIASGAVPNIGVWRTSYGAMGDWIHNNLLRASMLTPSAVRPSGLMTAASMINNPDKLGMIQNVSRQAQHFMREPLIQ